MQKKVKVKTLTKAVQDAVSVTSPSRNEVIQRVNDYFAFSNTPEETAKLLRKAAFTISEFQLLKKDELCTYELDMYDMLFYLNEMAEAIDPYFTKS